jgi:hypothetical protein
LSVDVLISTPSLRPPGGVQVITRYTCSHNGEYKGGSQANKKSYRVVDIMMDARRPEWNQRIHGEAMQEAEFETALDNFEAEHGTFEKEHGTHKLPRELSENFPHPEGYASMKDFVHKSHGVDPGDVKRQILLKVRA